jgi:hypothetical protein
MKGGQMEFWASFKGYIPGALILLVGIPLIYLGTRRPKEKSDKEEKKKQSNE